MGQKTNPIGLRVPVNREWRSKWYANKKDFGGLLVRHRHPHRSEEEARLGGHPEDPH